MENPELFLNYKITACQFPIFPQSCYSFTFISLSLERNKIKTNEKCHIVKQYSKLTYSKHTYNELMLKVKRFSFPVGFKHCVANRYNK